MDINNSKTNITLIDAWIMSAKSGIFIKKFIPDTSIDVYARREKIGAESSDAWNNEEQGIQPFEN